MVAVLIMYLDILGRAMHVDAFWLVYMTNLSHLFLCLPFAAVLSPNRVLTRSTSFQERRQAGASVHQNAGGTTESSQGGHRVRTMDDWKMAIGTVVA
jgi:hypothetical protein